MEPINASTGSSPLHPPPTNNKCSGGSSKTSKVDICKGSLPPVIGEESWCLTKSSWQAHFPQEPSGVSENKGPTIIPLLYQLFKKAGVFLNHYSIGLCQDIGWKNLSNRIVLPEWWNVRLLCFYWRAIMQVRRFFSCKIK